MSVAAAPHQACTACAERWSCADVTSSLFTIGERSEPPGVGVHSSVHSLRAPFGVSSPDRAGRLGLPRRSGCIQAPKYMYTTRHTQVPRVFSSHKFARCPRRKLTYIVVEFLSLYIFSRF